MTSLPVLSRLERAAGHACGPYRVPNVDVESVAAYTNNPPCGAMRGFGANQAQFAMEGVMDLLAEKAGLDGWEMLRRVQERHGVDAIQVIMYSGKLEEEGKAQERGAQAFIGKPFDRNELLARVRRVLQRTYGLTRDQDHSEDSAPLALAGPSAMQSARDSSLAH